MKIKGLKKAKKKVDVRKLIKRLWSNLTVMDATEPYTVTLKGKDFIGAEKKNPMNCALARCHEREESLKSPLAQSHSLKALFFPTVAYLERIKDGKRVVLRYKVPALGRAVETLFDLGALKSVPSWPVTLLPPRPSESLIGKRFRCQRDKAAWLSHRRKYDADYRARKKSKNYIPRQATIDERWFI